jgi:predicted ABC-class ATPase
MQKARDLRQQLVELDQRSYKAYKQIEGEYQFADFRLAIDHVQGDPFAAPSRLRVCVAQKSRTGEPIAGFPPVLYQTRSRAIALRDFLNRQFARVARNLREKRGSGKSGLIDMIQPSQQVLERTAVWIDDQLVEVRFVVGLPARGRQILGFQAIELLCEDIPQIVDQSLKYVHLDVAALQQHIETVEDTDWLRSQLPSQGLIAFIPNGAILPRQSGVDERPLTQAALPLQSPASLQVEFDCPNLGRVTGMGIPAGVTLIVGGGYHGKSTLLRALALGVYNHIPGDGRERVVTDATAVKIRAEDGRSITNVNISPFIHRLPQNRSTIRFSTDNASGSTSQAASIIEAIEVGARVLLIDEDTSATNFMIRDRRMQALIAKDKEPITPFIDKIRQLYEEHNISTILVIGGSGDYFDVADTVIAMTNYQPQEVTAQAKAIAAQFATQRVAEGGASFGQLTARIPLTKRLDSPSRFEQQEERRQPKLKVRDMDEIVFGSEAIDLSAVEQMVEIGQLRAIGAAIAYLQQHYINGRHTLAAIIKFVQADLDRAGWDILTAYPQGDLVEFRAFELAAALNRLRSLRIAE